MSIASKRVSLSTIISRVYSTIRPSDSDWVGQAVDSIGFAMKAIGFHIGFEQLATSIANPLITKGHRVNLPCNLERFLFVEELLTNNGGENLLSPNGTNIITEDENGDTCNFIGIRLRKGTDLALLSIDEENKKTINQLPVYNYYNIQGDYLVTAKEETTLRIHYKGYPLDKDGMPYIVNDFCYQECIFFYILSQMILQGYEIKDMSFDKAYNYFLNFVPKAQNSCKMPSIDEMETFENFWKKFSTTKPSYMNFNVHDERPSYINLRQ